MRLTISATYSESRSELDSNFSINSSESESEFNSSLVFMNLDINFILTLF